MRTCSTCFTEQPTSEYWLLRKHGEKYRAQCKACLSVRAREVHLKRKFGLTEEDYQTRLEEQDGGCYICGGDNNGRTLHVDHDHKTGKIRALLCYSCNTLLGYAHDNVDILESAIDYLSKDWS